MFDWTYEPYISSAYEAIKSKIHHINLFGFQIAQKCSRKDLVSRIENGDETRKTLDGIVINSVYFSRFDIKYQQINDWCAVQKQKSQNNKQTSKWLISVQLCSKALAVVIQWKRSLVICHMTTFFCEWMCVSVALSRNVLSMVPLGYFVEKAQRWLVWQRWIIRICE